MAGRYIWGLQNKYGEIVLSAPTSEKLGGMIGVCAGTVKSNYKRGFRLDTEPYCGCRVVRWPRDGLDLDVPYYSVEHLRTHGTREVWKTEIPCNHCGARKACGRLEKCAAIRIWTGNVLRAMRIVCGLQEPRRQRKP